MASVSSFAGALAPQKARVRMRVGESSGRHTCSDYTQAIALRGGLTLVAAGRRAMALEAVAFG